jgi:hypothetical protein
MSVPKYTQVLALVSFFGSRELTEPMKQNPHLTHLIYVAVNLCTTCCKNTTLLTNYVAQEP